MIAGFLTVAIGTIILSATNGFAFAASKSPEMGVIAMAASLVVVPIVSLLTKKNDLERVEGIFKCYNEK